MTRATSSSQQQQTSRRRWAGALFIAGPVIFLLTELIAASAWKKPGDSYIYDFISDLGVHGPSTLFGQYMYSPLAWVMNAGFFLFGLVILAGVIVLPSLIPGRRWAVLVPAIMLGAGGILLAFFHGSGQALEDGTGQFHSLGAFAGFIGGNVLVIVLGSMRHRFGFTLIMGRALVIVGIIGLLSMVGYLVAIFTATDDTVGLIGVVGLIERGAVHPFLITLICAGANLLSHPAAPARETSSAANATAS